MGPLISTTELAARLDRSVADGDGLVILDSTTTLPGERFDPDAAFLEAHLPGARRFDLDLFSDPDSSLPHAVPSPGRFARLIETLGVSNSSEIVFYDQTGVVSAARGWWLLQLFGHDRVQVLDGGLPAWRAENRAVDAGEPKPIASGRFTAALRAHRLAGLGDMMELSRQAEAGATGAARLLDARGRGRFEATVPEPRPGLPGGHIPGAVSLPFGELLVDGHRFRPMSEVRARFAEAGVGAGDAVVTSCGSGLTASVLSLGLVACGLEPGALYDGSWTEWAQAPVPRSTGAGR